MKKIILFALSWLASLSIFSFIASLFFYSWATLAFPFSVVFSSVLADPQQQAAFQYTRSGRTFKDYVAIFGDSYAFGQGDGMQQLQSRYRPSYNVTHFIHKDLGIDIASFGVPSSGSVKSYIVHPENQISSINKSYFNNLENPSYIVLYFYEGNDIEENVFENQSMLLDNGYSSEKFGYVYSSQVLFDQLMDAYNKNSDGVHKVIFIDVYRMISFIKNAVIFSLGFEKKIYDSAPTDPSQTGNINRIKLQGRDVGVPDGLQGPSMLLGADETDQGFAVLERSVHYVKSLYPDTPIVMVHIPSPATVYQFSSDEIDLWDLIGVSSGFSRKPSADIRPRSNDFCQRAMVISKKEGVLFHDARPAIVEQGRQRFLHGPIDWHHFNLYGYKVLSGEVEKAILAMKSGSNKNLQECVDIH